MAQKSKGAKGDDLKQEQILQAVVIADSFNVKFGPVTEKKPRALLPLVNVPMLDCTLDLLASGGVQETFIFCCHLAADICNHIRHSRWGGGEEGGMAVKMIVAENCNSMGDALREIDRRSLVGHHFFLLNCDTITNADLRQLMQDHRDRHKKIPSSVMTMTCMKVLPRNRLRCAEDNVFLALSPDTKQVYDYQRITLENKIRINLKKHGDMELHQDLLDGQLYICSPTVLNLFTDNFDYSSIDDLVRGIIINQEIYGNTVHVNVLRNKYCARITNPYMYDIISQDMLMRKTLPVGPRLMMSSAEDTLMCRENGVYLGPDLTLASSTQLARNVVVGKGSTIGAYTFIKDSVIGPGSIIGASVQMENCYLWGKVKVEDGCVLKHAILCDGVTVLTGTTVQPQSILSWNVTVGPDIKLPPGIRLQDTPPTDEFADDTDEQAVPETTPEYGEKSRAFLYTPSSDDADSDIDDEDELCFDWGKPLVDPNNRDDEDDDESISSIDPGDLEDESEEEVDEYGKFCEELMDTLRRANKESIQLENLVLEINSLKHAYNIAIKEVHQAVVKVLVEMPLSERQTPVNMELVTAVMQHVKSHIGLLKHYIKEEEAQTDCLHTLEDFAVENDRMLKLLRPVVQCLYDGDILEEHIILKWYYSEAVEEEEEEHAKVRKQMELYITWLEQAEEESDED